MNYPEHQKLKKIAQSAEICGIFLNWLQQKYVFIDKNQSVIFPQQAYIDKQSLLAEFFNIDLSKIAEEKDQMVQNCLL